MRDRTIVFIVSLIMLSMVCSTVSADTFGIGTKISEIEDYNSNNVLIGFDDNTVARTAPDYADYVTQIFDGDTQTGIDHDFGGGHNSMSIRIWFFTKLNVTNITVKPEFGGSSTPYYLWIQTGSDQLALKSNEASSAEVKFDIGFHLDSVSVLLDNGGTNQFNFGDVIINYTPAPPTPIEELEQRVTDLEATVGMLQQDIQNLTDLFDALNATVDEMNATQQSILESITGLWVAYDALNLTVTDFIDNHEDYNDTWISENLTSIGADIAAIQAALADISFNDTDFDELKESINQTSNDIVSLTENLTMVKDTMPDAYNDTALLATIAQLEGENQALSEANDALGIRMALLEADMAEQDKKIIELEDDLEEEAGGLATLPLVLSILSLVVVMIMLAWWASTGSKKERTTVMDDEEE